MTDILKIDAREWSTPLTGLEGRVGRARLSPTTYGRGYYYLEGIPGYRYYEVINGRLPVQQLQRREPGTRHWRTWMVDDPVHWYGMRERVLRLRGPRVVIAGLGLGIMAHHIVNLRPDIHEAVVVDIDPDVITLVSPTVPKTTQIRVIEDDFYAYIKARVNDPPDSILWDLAVGDQEDTLHQLIEGATRTLATLPDVPLYQFGVRNVDNVLQDNRVMAMARS